MLLVLSISWDNAPNLIFLMVHHLFTICCFGYPIENSVQRKTSGVTCNLRYNIQKTNTQIILTVSSQSLHHLLLLSGLRSYLYTAVRSIGHKKQWLIQAHTVGQCEEKGEKKSFSCRKLSSKIRWTEIGPVLTSSVILWSLLCVQKEIKILKPLCLKS